MTKGTDSSDGATNQGKPVATRSWKWQVMDFSESPQKDHKHADTLISIQ